MRRCLFYFTTQRTGLLPLLYKGSGGFSRPEYRVAMLSSLPGASPAFSSASPDGIDAREKLHDQPAGQNGMMARPQDEGGLPPTGDKNAASAHFGRWLALCPLYSNGIFFFAPGAAKRPAQARARIPVWPRPCALVQKQARTCAPARARPLPAAEYRRRNRRRTRAPAQAWLQETACFLRGTPVLRREGAAQKEKPARLRTRGLCFVYHGPGRGRAAPAGRGHSSIRSWSFSSSRYFTVSFR